LNRRTLGWLLAIWLPIAPLAAGAMSDDVRRMEAVGVFPLDPERPAKQAPRDAAVRSAVRDAVQRTALALLPDGFQPGEVADAEPEVPESLPQSEAAENADSAEIGTARAVWLDQVLGEDPFEFATRFRILEDRGIRPALLSGRPDVTSEYVVVVEVFVDAGRVRERLRSVGALEVPAGVDPRFRTRFVIEGADSYPAYEALQRALRDDAGVSSALPLEMQRGRIVLEVLANREAAALLDDLLAATPAGLQVIPLESSDDTITLLVSWSPSAPSDVAEDPHP